MILKALIVGINKYKGNHLNFCVDDAKEIGNLFAYNENKERNFEILPLLDESATYINIKNGLKNVFDDDTDVGLFYFSGHGYAENDYGYLVTYDFDFSKNFIGLRFDDILNIIAKSKCKNKIIILDSCYSGRMGEEPLFGNNAILPLGTTILTACRNKEVSLEINGHGLFTNLLIQALKGGASDILGNITPGSIYSFVDSSLGNFEQRPVFKTNVSSFIALRKTKPKITQLELRKLHSLFHDINEKFQLDSSFEPTNYPGSTGIGSSDLREPYFKKENGKTFSLLQKAEANGLIIPSNEQHMFYAALNADTCELTPLGKHYWYMVEKNKI